MYCFSQILHTGAVLEISLSSFQAACLSRMRTVGSSHRVSRGVNHWRNRRRYLEYGHCIPAYSIFLHISNHISNIFNILVYSVFRSYSCIFLAIPIYSSIFLYIPSIFLTINLYSRLFQII